jgi:hypothetical protein
VDKELFTSQKMMKFKNVATGEIVETDNMFFVAFPTIWEFIGYSTQESGGE